MDKAGRTIRLAQHVTAARLKHSSAMHCKVVAQFEHEVILYGRWLLRIAGRDGQLHTQTVDASSVFDARIKLYTDGGDCGCSIRVR